MRKIILTVLVVIIAQMVHAQLQGSWIPRGPNSLVGAYSGVKGIGRTECIAIDPTDTNTIFVVSTCGSLWKSTNDGNNWSLFKEVSLDSKFSYIKFDPFDGNVLYAVISGKLYKSTDTAVTWTLLNASVDPYGFKLLIDPFNSQNLLYTYSGLHKSIDGGLSWNIINANSYRDLEMNPLNPNVLYGLGASNTVVKSVDGGATFSSSASIPVSYGTAELAVTMADTNYVYVFSAQTNNYRGHVALSTDGGATFIVHPVTTNMLNNTGLMHFEVSPVDKNLLINGGIDCSRSTDGGLTWSYAAKWGYGQLSTLDYLHVDNRFITFNGSSFWSCNDGGVYKSVDGGQHWIDKSAGMGIGIFYSLASSETDSSVFIGGTLDDAMLMHTASGWVNIFGGDGYDAAIKPNDPLSVYGKNQYNYQRSVDGGVTIVPSAFFTGCTESTYGYHTGFPIQFNYMNTNSMFMLVDNVWKSIDNGNHAVAISNFSVANKGGEFLYVCKTDSNIIFTKHNRTLNGGLSWTPLTKIIATVDPDEPGMVWATNNGGEPFGIFYSSDSANTWTEIPSCDIAGIGAMQMRCANNAHNGVFIFSGVSIYYIDDRLSNWQPFNEGLPQLKVYDMNVLDNFKKVRVSTAGRGVWESNLFDTTKALVVDFIANKHLSVCAGDTVCFYDNSLNNGPAYNPVYQWSFPGGSPSTSTAAAPQVLYSTLGTYSVTLIISNSNGADTILKTNYISVNTSQVPSQPGQIFGDTAVCLYSNQIYTIDSVAGATSYTWTLPSGWGGVIGNLSSTIVRTQNQAVSSGLFTVTANNSCGSSPPQTLLVTSIASAPTQPGSITGNSSVCQGSSEAYFISPVSGATSYHWVLPLGWTGSSTTTSITATAGGSGGTISVTAINACDTSLVRSIAISVNSQPGQPSISTNGTTTFCQGDSVLLYSSTANSYLWSTGETTQSIVADSTENYSVTITDMNGCSASSALVATTLYPQPTLPLITPASATTFCQGDSVVLHSSAANSYLWSTGETTQSVVVDSMGIYSVTITDTNGCSAISLASTITVYFPQSGLIVSFNNDTLYSPYTQPNYWFFEDSIHPIDSGSIHICSQSGDYFVQGLDINGCAAISDTLFVNCILVGIPRFTNVSSFQAYPNPTNGLLNIVATDVDDGNYMFILENTMGQIIFEDNSIIENNAIQKTFLISPLSSGIYFLTIKSAKMNTVIKISKLE